MNTLTEFDKAFLLAYKHVNQCPDCVAIEYINAKTDKQQDEFYKNHSEYYSHLMDTYSTFRDGFNYAKQVYLFTLKKEQVKQLLNEYHAAEIGKLMDISESEGKKIVREIMLFDWGYTDWLPKNIGDGFVLFCNGAEWIDENGENLVFETEEQAQNYIDEVTA